MASPGGTRLPEEPRGWETAAAVGERALPHNAEAERTVLGAVLVDNSAFNSAAEILSRDDFHREAHRRIFDAMAALAERSSPIDPVTLKDELQRAQALEAVGGPSYLAALMDGVPRVTNLEPWCRIIKEKSVLRALIHAGTRIVNSAYDAEEAAASLLDQAEKVIFEIAERRIREGFVNIRDVVKESFRTIDQLSQSKDVVTGLPTGFVDLDEKTSGLQKGDLVIVAARPAMGKTSFCLNLAQNATYRTGETIGIFSLEMSKEQLVLRLLCSDGRIDSHRLRTGNLQEKDWARLAKAYADLSQAHIFIDDASSLTPLEMRAKCRRLKAEHGLGLVIVDYLQLMSGGGRVENRQQEISAISRSLKGLAKELACPVIALSQLSRAPEARTDRRPQLADLRECVTGDTLVMLADGRRVPIAELVGSAPDVLAVVDGRVVPAHSDRVWKVGQRPVFEVVLTSGRRLRATGQHRLLGASGWVRVEELRAGDRLALARRIPVPVDAVTWSEDRLILLGHLVGDGSYLSGQPLRYTTGSEENSAAVAQAAQREFGTVVSRHAGRGAWHQLVFSDNGTRRQPRGLDLWLRQLGVLGQRSHQRRLPPEVFQLADVGVACLLRHLWATDGSITVRRPGQRGAPRVSFSTCSPGLAGDVAALLLRFGIVARLRSVHERGGHRPTWTVDVSGSAQQRRFVEAVGAFGPRRLPAAALAEALTERSSNPNVDTLPQEVFADVKQAMAQRGLSQRAMASLRGTSYGGGAHFSFAPSRAVVADYGRLLGDERLRQRAADDLFWDSVAAVQPAGEHEVYDLTVPGPASWLADGVVSHNSGAIEQDADVVMFIYREEEHKPTDENRGIAEIIIGKQRNGPTGSLKLAFLKEYTRFENLDYQR